MVAVVDFDTPSARLPEGWSVVTDLPIQIVGGAIVDAVDSGIVVLQQSSTVRIGFDGSWDTGEAPPLSIPDSCCGGADGLPAGDALVLIGEGSTTTWILDVETLTWLQADPRPATEYVLGSVLLGGDLFVVTGAARTGEATATRLRSMSPPACGESSSRCHRRSRWAV
jgi:hypothetical protein